MSDWRLLYVEDDIELANDVKVFLEKRIVSSADDRLIIEVLSDFSRALEVLETHRYDLLILDVKLNLDDIEIEDQGRVTLETIQAKRFIPVIFYTAAPQIVRDLQTPLVKIVEKASGVRNLLKVIIEIFETRIPAVNRALIHYVEAIQRDYMWNFVAKHWSQIGDTGNHTDLAYLLARRLGLSLSGSGIHNLAQELGIEVTRDIVAESKIHPMRYYIIPPIEEFTMAGDIYKCSVEGREEHWVVLTPSCDLAQGKAERILLACGILLESQPEYQKWCANDNPSTLKNLLKNTRKETGYQPDRYHYLPGAFNLPHLIVDFQHLTTKTREQLNGPEYTRLASLDSPFVEALISRFIRYFGRLGTPDLDVDLLLEKLKNARTNV